ncbi:MAG: hypothetical protein Q9181_008348, partial [Wetmoreana brouardii]
MESDIDARSMSAERSRPPHPDAMQVAESGRHTGCETENADKPENPEILPYVTASPASETKATGAISWKLFKLYFNAFGKWYYWIAMILMFFVNQLSSLSIELWIREWANAYHKEERNTARMYRKSNILPKFGLALLCPGHELAGSRSCGDTSWNSRFVQDTSIDVGYYLTVYAMLAGVFMVVKALRMSLLFRGSLSASQSLHDQLLRTVTRATFRFYDATPFGQLVNRFSRDTEVIDQELAP